MQLPRPLLSSSSKNKKKIHPEKKYSYTSGNGTFFSPNNLIKLFYTFNETPLGETGCLSNLYYLLTAQTSSFLIHHPFPNTVT